MIPFIGIVQTEKCRRWQHRMKKQQKWMRAPIPVLPQVPPCCTGRRLAPRSLCLPKENRGASSMCWLPHPLTEGDPTPGLTPLQRQKEVWGQGRDRQTGNNNKTSCKPGNTKHTACQLQRCYTNHSHSTQHTQVQDAHSTPRYRTHTAPAQPTWNPQHRSMHHTSIPSNWVPSVQKYTNSKNHRYKRPA